MQATCHRIGRLANRGQVGGLQQSQPLLGESLLSGGEGGRLFRELLLDTFARVAAEREAFGIGRELLEQMRERAGSGPAGGAGS